jgi:chorismate mutase
MTFRGIRGATTVDENSEETILAATQELLEVIVAANDVQVDDIASVIFTATPDLDSAHPARAARQMGWIHVPLLCVQEMEVVESLARCIRLLIHWNTDVETRSVKHIYLRGAKVLRPDLVPDANPAGSENYTSQSRREHPCHE